MFLPFSWHVEVCFMHLSHPKAGAKLWGKGNNHSGKQKYREREGENHEREGKIHLRKGKYQIGREKYHGKGKYQNGK